MININMEKAKKFSHERRRSQRQAFFDPNTAIIQKSASGIPLADHEDATKALEDNANYKANIDNPMQEAIEAANGVEDLKRALGVD